MISMAVRSRISPFKQARGSTPSLFTFKGRRRQKSVSSAGSGTTTPMSEADTAVASFDFSECVESEGERPACLSKASLVLAEDISTDSSRSTSEVNWACVNQGTLRTNWMPLYLPLASLLQLHSAKLRLKWMSDGAIAANMEYTGIGLVSNARVVSRQLGSDSAFERKLYLDGLGYLLRGLPVDITFSSLEVENIRASLPKSVLAQTEDASGANEPCSCRRSSNRRIVRQSNNTLLRRAVQAITGLVIVFWLLLWPLISAAMRTTVRLAMHLERRYKVAEQIEARVARTLTTTIEHGLNFATGISRQGFKLSNAMGPSLGEMVVWILEEFTEGISRGLEQGCQAAGNVYTSEDN
jgi:hypothetical protein